MSGKAPAFQFYANDFLGGTLEMSTGEAGAYIRLLCFQWINGSLPNDQEKCARIAGSSIHEIRAIWNKFEVGEDGRIRNPRLEDTRQKSEEYRASRRENGAKGGRPQKPQGNHMVSIPFPETEPQGNHSAKHTANHSETSSSSSSSSISSPSPTSPPSSNPPPQTPTDGAPASPSLGGGGSAADKLIPTTEPALFIAEMFSRRATTAWSAKEVKAFKAVGEIDMADLELIARYYASERAKGTEGIHRRDLKTFLNNFHGELDRARAFATKPTSRQKPEEYPENLLIPDLTPDANKPSQH